MFNPFNVQKNKQLQNSPSLNLPNPNSPSLNSSNPNTSSLNSPNSNLPVPNQSSNSLSNFSFNLGEKNNLNKKNNLLNNLNKKNNLLNNINKINNQSNSIIEKQNLVVNLNNLKENYSDKHHYFIGSVMSRENIKPLQNIQKILKNQMFQNVRWNLPFHARYIYLGYLDSAVVNEIMNKIFNPLCLAISEKYKKFNCKYEKVLYRNKPPRDRGNKIISLQFKDENDKINKVIIPYLKKEGLKKIYDVESKMEKPHIDLLYLNCEDAVYKQIASSSPKIRFPPYGFEIDHLCLIKGTPYAKKFGIPSKYDRLNIEVVRDYYYPLRGEM